MRIVFLMNKNTLCSFLQTHQATIYLGHNSLVIQSGTLLSLGVIFISKIFLHV